MKLKRNLTKNEDGSVDAIWTLSPEETSYLVNYAIGDLLQRGLATVEDSVKLEELEAQGGVQ